MGSIIVVAFNNYGDAEHDDGRCYSTKYDGKIGDKVRTLQYIRPIHCIIPDTTRIKV